MGGALFFSWAGAIGAKGCLTDRDAKSADFSPILSGPCPRPVGARLRPTGMWEVFAGVWNASGPGGRDGIRAPGRIVWPPFTNDVAPAPTNESPQLRFATRHTCPTPCRISLCTLSHRIPNQLLSRAEGMPFVVMLHSRALGRSPGSPSLLLVRGLQFLVVSIAIATGILYLRTGSPRAGTKLVCSRANTRSARSHGEARFCRSL